MRCDFFKIIGWNNILPDYDNYPESFKRVVPFLLASLVYHQDWIRSTFSRKHPIFNQEIFTKTFTYKHDNVTEKINIMHYFKGKVLLGKGRCDETNLQATGIPDHLIIADQIVTLKNQIELLSKTLQQNQEEIRKGHELIIKEILDALSQQPSQLRSMILENFRVENVVPISSRDIERMLNERDERMFARMISFTEANHSSIIANTIIGSGTDARQSFEFSYFTWGGKLRMCPENFEFPLSDVRTMFNLWHFGNSTEKIQPYKHFDECRDDLRLKKHKNNFSRAKLVMNKLNEIFRNCHLLGDHNDITQIDSIEGQNFVFDRAYEKLIEICYNGQATPHKRPNDIQLNTFAKRLRQNELS